MNNVVAVRIDRFSLKKIKSQLLHYLRVKVPSYLRRDDTNKFYFYQSNNQPPKFLDFTKDDTQILKSANKTVVAKIDKIKDEIEDDYRKTYKQKLSKLTNHFISGVIVFGVDELKKSIRVSQLINNASLTKEEVDEINSIDKDEMYKCAKNFIDDFNKTYGTKPVYLVAHEDEKTVHFHFTVSHYSFTKHKFT